MLQLRSELLVTLRHKRSQIVIVRSPRSIVTSLNIQITFFSMKRGVIFFTSVIFPLLFLVLATARVGQRRKSESKTILRLWHTTTTTTTAKQDSMTYLNVQYNKTLILVLFLGYPLVN